MTVTDPNHPAAAHTEDASHPRANRASPKAPELEIPELWSWCLERSPYLVFCVAGDGLIDIWRVLHVPRDVPAHLTDEPPV